MNEREQLWQQLETLSRRVASLEARLNAQAGPSPTAEHVGARIEALRELQRSRRTPPVAEMTVAMVEPPPLPAPEPPSVAELVAAAFPVADAAVPPPLPVSTPPVVPIQPIAAARPPIPVRAKYDIERMIGGRWVAAVGAIILVIGVGLGLKWAYDQGLLRVSPVWRCVIAALFGFGLLGGGDVIRRRYGAWAGAGVLAAGIGTIYTAVFAAYNLYGLFGAPVAFGLLAATAALGIGVGVRARLAAVSVISLVAGYLTPLVFANVPPTPYVLPAYLLTLLAVGLVLSGWLGRAFGALRTVVWFGTLIMGGLWAFAEPEANTPWTCVFLAIVWAAMHAELWWSARQGQLVAPEGALAPPRGGWSAWRPLLSSFSTTAWAAGITGMLLHDWAAVPAWLGSAAYMVATLLVALPLSGHLRFVRDQPATDGERLGAVLIVQAAGLLFATVALAASGMAELFAWLALAVAAAVAGRWLNARAFWVYGLLVLLFATARLFLYDTWSGRLMAGGQSIYGGVTFTSWSLLAACTAAAWFGIGAVVRDPARPGWRGIAHACLGVGFTILAACALHKDSNPGGVAVMFMLSGLAASFTGLRLAAPGLRTHAVCTLGFASLLGAFTLWYRATPSVVGSGEHFILPGAAFVFVAAAVAWGALAGMMRVSDTTGDIFRRGVAVGAALVCLFLFSIHQRTPLTALAPFWTASCALYVLLASLDRRLPWALAAFVGLLLTTGLWAAAFPIQGREWLDSSRLEFGLLVGLAVASLLVLAARWMPGDPRGRTAATGTAWGVALLIIFTATSFEVMGVATRIAEDTRVRAAGVSLWWAAFAAAMIVAGFWRRVPIVRHLGLGLLAVAAFKTVILDLRGVPQLWRVIGFLGLGMLMLGVAVVYGKVTAKLDKATEG